ncbi:hypothetical protein GcM3_188026, partial [Golovinomyces cichoracearum]
NSFGNRPKQPCIVLDSDNFREFFKTQKLWLKTRGWLYVFEQKKHEFAAATNPTNNSSANGFDPEKLRIFDHHDASARYSTRQLLSNFDRELFDSIECTKDAWNAVKKEYLKTDPKDVRKLEKEITTCKKGSGISIKRAWVQLDNLRSKVVEADPLKTTSYTETSLLGYLLEGLDDNVYKTAKCVLDLQPSLSGKQRLDSLQNFFEENEATKQQEMSAFVTRNADYKRVSSSPTAHQPWSQYTPSSSPSRSQTTDIIEICYMCGGRNHYVRHCEFRHEAQQFVQRLRLDKEKREKSKDHRMGPYRPQNKRGSPSKTVKFADESKAFWSETEDNLESSDENELEIVTDDEVSAYVTDEVRKNLQRSDSFIYDTGCTNDMTDKYHLFTSKLIPISRRWIKVGGGRIFSDYKGSVLLKCPDGSSGVLDEVLLVEGLGVNLLSAKKFVREIMQKESKLDNGLYKVDHISGPIERALTSQEDNLERDDHIQYRLYAPDLHKVFTSSYTKFKENVKGSSITDFRLWIKSGLEFNEGQNDSTPAVRKSRGRPIDILKTKPLSSGGGSFCLNNDSSTCKAQSEKLPVIPMPDSNKFNPSVDNNPIIILPENDTNNTLPNPTQIHNQTIPSALTTKFLCKEPEHDIVVSDIQGQNYNTSDKSKNSSRKKAQINTVPKSDSRDSTQNIKSKGTENNLRRSKRLEVRKEDQSSSNKSIKTLMSSTNASSSIAKPLPSASSEISPLTELPQTFYKSTSRLLNLNTENFERKTLNSIDKQSDRNQKIPQSHTIELVPTPKIENSIEPNTNISSSSISLDTLLSNRLLQIEPATAKPLITKSNEDNNEDLSHVPSLDLMVIDNDKPKVYTGEKRKRYTIDDNETDNSQRNKILRAMLAIIDIVKDADDSNTEHALLFDFLVSTALICQEIPIPRTYKQAVNDPTYGKMWREAIEEEIKSLTANKTWEEVFKPYNANLISKKWGFTVKSKPDGSLDRFKVRLVAKGFTQRLGTDYEDTFAPTVQMESLRSFLAICVVEDLEIAHFEIKNAFTEASSEASLFLRAPEGVDVKPGNALKVIRSIYGLK